MLVLFIVEFGLRAFISFSVAAGIYISQRTLLDLILAIICMTGLFGFVYKKRIIANWFWIIFFIFIVLYDGWEFCQEMILENNRYGEHAEETGTLDFIISIVFDPILSVIFYIALFLYGFRSKEIWKKPANDA